MPSEKQLTIIDQALEWSYDKAVNGLGVFGSAQSLGEEYLESNNNNKLDAINSLIRWQNAKAATGGFITNVGGLVTLPVAIPANMTSSLYIQIRMIAGIAHIAGHDLFDDKIKTLCFICLTGNSAGEIVKKAGVQLGTKFASSSINKYITGEMLKAINKAVGFRLMTKAGSKGIFNLTKMVPLVGGAIGGGFDAFSTNVVGKTARKAFLSPDSEFKMFTDSTDIIISE